MNKDSLPELDSDMLVADFTRVQRLHKRMGPPASWEQDSFLWLRAGQCFCGWKTAPEHNAVRRQMAHTEHVSEILLGRLEILYQYGYVAPVRPTSRPL